MIPVTLFTTFTNGAPALEPRNDTRAAVVAGFLGWTLDAFDFFLVVMCLTGIAAEFGRPDKDVALTLTMTLAFRPVGAFVFGLLADRYGRRLPLMLDLIFYSVVEVLSGLAPSYTTFLILRALFGIGMGGEWGVGASLVMEKVPPHKRGMFSGLLQQGYAAGYLLAALCYLFVFPRWGWRPLFFIGGLPALLALYVRLQVTESEVWKRTRHHDWSGLGRTIVSHWKLFLYITLLMAGMNFASHGTQDIYPTFLKRHWGFGPGKVTALTALSMVGALSGGVLFGVFMDVTLIVLVAVGTLALVLGEERTALAQRSAQLEQLSALLLRAQEEERRRSPDSVRGFLPGFAYQCGVLIASIMPRVQTGLAERLPYPWAMSLSAGTVFILAAVAAALGRERKGIAYGTAPPGQ